MHLPPQVRRELGRQLLDSSDPTAQGDPSEVGVAWDAEIARRMQGYRDGSVELIELIDEGDVRGLLGQ